MIEQARWVCKCGAGFRWFCLLYEHGRDCPDYQERHSGVAPAESRQMAAEGVAARSAGSDPATPENAALTREGSEVAAHLSAPLPTLSAACAAPEAALPLPLL
jgi:hypothetical protein